MLEQRQLLSGDLTQQIINLVDGGTTTGTVELSDVSLGGFLSASSVTVSFEDFSQQADSSWSGTVSVSADTASIAIGEDFTAQILGNGTSGSVGLGGSYTLNDQPLDQGSYALTVTELSASIPNILSASASGVQLQYSPSGSSSQEIAQVGSLSATIIPLNNTQLSLSNLDIYENGFTLGDATVGAGSITLGGFLAVDNPSLSFSDVAYTDGGALSGTISIGVGTATLFPNQSLFSASVDGFQGSYDLDTDTLSLSATSASVTIGQILDAQITGTTADPGLSIDYDTSSSALTVAANTISLTSPAFPGLSATATDLQAGNTGLTLGNATLQDSSSITLGGFLEVSGLEVAVSGLDYQPSEQPVFGGTISISATSASLFPNQSLFSASVEGFQGSYDLNTSTLSLSATSASVTIGQILDAEVTGTTADPGLSIVYDGSNSTYSVSANTISLTSPAFPGISATATDLQASNSGFSLGNATLQDSSSITLGGVLKVDGLTISVSGLDYQLNPPSDQPALGGTITFGAQSVSLFAGQKDFTTTISDPTGKSSSGLSASYNLNTQALNFQLDQVEIQVSDLFDVTADSVSVDVTPGSFGMTVGSATVSVPKLAGFQGSVQVLAITSDGFSIGKATLGFTGNITLGSVLTISNPSASISGLSYSIQSGAQFNGDISFGLSASLKVGGAASASVSGLDVTLGLTSQDYGQFLVTANSASFTLGSYLTLTATGTTAVPLEFNTAATSGQDIVQFGTVTAQLNAGPLSVSATGQDFGIDSNGNFVALTGFGIEASASAAGGIDAASAFKWPTWLPIHVSKLALTWPDFNDDPSNFSIDISAGINASLAGLTLSGNVQDAVLNVQDIINGEFPLTSLGGAGFQVGGTFAGVTFNAEGFLATTTGANRQTILYGGIDGGVSIAGLAGFQIMLGLSSLGPLDIYAMVDAPIILDPDTGLAITGLSAGINFGGGLATPDSAKDLGQVAQSVFAPTLSQWESQLAGDVAGQISSGASWTNPPTLLTIQGGATLFDAYASPDAFELSGNIAFDTTGKLLASGTLVMGATVDVQGSAFIDLSQVASGKAVLMLNVDAPANTPIVTAYGTVDFEFDGPVFNAVQAPTGSSTPQLGDGLVLDGSTGYGSAPNIDLNNTSYTVEFWAQRSQTGQEEYVIGQGPSTSTTGLSIGFDTNNDFVVNSDGTTLSFPAGQDTSWHQWAVTFDMTSGTLSIYRDGVLEDSATKVDPIQGASSTLLLGKSGSIFFGGGVDEVRVWSMARTAAQVEDNVALQAPSPTTGLLADWSFSEGQGTTAADNSGNGNTMTLTGGATWAPTVIDGISQLPAGPVTAETASAVELDGTDAYASASGINLNDSSFSIEFWAKQNDTARLEYIINQGDPPSSGGLQIGFDASNNFFVSMGGTTLTTPTNDNNWHEWAVTFDATTGTLMIYQDGVPVAGTTANPISIAGSTPAFLIGKSGSYYFDGDITQLRVWTVVRTEADINSDMVSSTPTSTIGLLAVWNFSEGTGTTAADSSGNGHDATINGGTQWITATLPTIPTPAFEGFTITISGGIDLTVPDVPGGLEITGTASFRVDASAGSLQLNVSGMVDLAPLGNALDLEGVVHFDLGPEPYSDPKPEFYGIFVLQTGQLFNTLSRIGLNVNGMAVLRFNTTPSDIPIDLPIPNSDPTQPASLQSFVIQADAVSLMIQGDVNFQLQGTQWFGLSGTFDAIFQDPNNQPELDILENASLIIGPPDSPIVEFDTTGFLRLWSGGVAAQFLVTFDAQDSSVLEDAGIDFSSPIDPLTGKPVVNQFEFELNTSGQAVSFTAPTLTSSDPGLTGDSSGLTINIPAGAPQPDGSTAAPGPYMVVEGSGGFELDNSFAVLGSFYLEVTTSQFLLETDAQLFLQVQGNTLLDLQANGGIDISSQGIYGAIRLTLNTGLPTGYGFSLNAGYLLEVNTTSQTPTIAGITIPAGPFAEIKATGDLDVGTIDLSGSFVFEVDGSGVMITLTAQAALGPLGQADVNGELVIQSGSSAGIYGILQAALATSPDITDVSLSLSFQFEINTTNAPQRVTGFTVDQTTGQITTGQQINIDAGTTEFDAGGNLTIVNMFDVAGQFDFTLNSSSVQIDAHAALMGFFGLNLGLSAQFDLTSGGLAVNAGLSLNESLPLGLLSISASPQLLINTTSQTLNGVAPGTYEVELNNADMNFLGLQASGTLIVGVSDGIFEIDVPSSSPLQLSFFGLGGVSISGYIDSNGQFSLTGSLGFQLGQSGNDIWGSLQITISNNGFSGYFSGGAQIFGINVASVSGWLSINDGEIDLGAWVSVWIFSFSFNIEIGSLSTPSNAPNSLLFYSVPTTANAGSTMSLNASATDGSGNAVDSDSSAYQWTIYYNNAVYARETGGNPNLKLGDPGTYTIVMNEGSVSKTSTIQVADVPPTVSSLNLQTGYADEQSVTLAPSVYSPLPEAPGGLHYQWTILKDGQPFATANTPNYTFTPATPSMSSEGAPVPDVYQVSLTVSDNYGGSVTASGSFGTFDPNNIVVTTTQDLTSFGNVTSLRVAIQEAASVPGVHYVKFASDLAGQTITLTTVGDSSDDGNSAIRIPGGAVVLDASNAPGVTIAASGDMRLFYVPMGSTLELEDLNLSNGYEIGNGNGAYGGAIYADGAVYASNCAFVNNTAVGDYYDVAGGGAIYVSTSGYLSAIETTFGDNSASGYQHAAGGAIDTAGALSLDGVTIADNLLSGSSVAGGGIYDSASNQPNPFTPGGSPFSLNTVLSNVLIADNSGGVDFDYEGNSGGQINDALIDTSANIPSVIFQ
ncbi:MAG: beta strand repeat-containing protein, partial [Isosphaeraceae bacterium]